MPDTRIPDVRTLVPARRPPADIRHLCMRRWQPVNDHDPKPLVRRGRGTRSLCSSHRNPTNAWTLAASTAVNTIGG